MKPFVEILRTIAEYPWSIEDPDFDNVAYLLEDSPKLIHAARSANSFIFRLNELPFKNYEHQFLTEQGVSKYDTPPGKITKVQCEGNSQDLRLDLNLATMPSQTGRPTSYNRVFINGEDKLILYPTPNAEYNITVTHETFNAAKRLMGSGAWEAIVNLKDDKDVVNVPEAYEDAYLEVLYAKTMHNLIIDNTDENFVPYEQEYMRRLQVLRSMSGLDIESSISY